MTELYNSQVAVVSSFWRSLSSRGSWILKFWEKRFAEPCSRFEFSTTSRLDHLGDVIALRTSEIWCDVNLTLSISARFLGSVNRSYSSWLFESTNVSFKKITQNSREKSKWTLIFFMIPCVRIVDCQAGCGEDKQILYSLSTLSICTVASCSSHFSCWAMRQRITVDVRDNDTMLNVCGLRKRSVDFSIAARWEMSSASFSRCQKKNTQNSLDLRLNHVGCVHLEINKFFLSNLYDRIFRTWNSCSAVF